MDHHAAGQGLYFEYPRHEHEGCEAHDALLNSKLLPEQKGCGDVDHGPPMSQEEAKTLIAAGEDPTQNNGWIAQVLEAHNSLRAKHGAPPLKWSAECAEKAQLAANNAAAKNTLVHTHYQEYGHGQNGFGGTPGHSSATHAIEKWYSESKSPGYNFPAANGCPGTGHFTQVVWKNCAEVGMTCDSEGKGFIFANYWPPANSQGQYDENVFPEGTPMQIRKLVRRAPFEDTVDSLTQEAQEVLDSVKNHKITRKLTLELEAGRPVKMEYKPGPHGSLKYTLKSGAMGMCT